MRLYPIAAISLSLAAPALATGGFDCRATDGSDIGMSGTVGHVVGAPLVGASLHLGERTLATTDPDPQIVIARSWIDEHEMRVDLADPQLERFEARLRARPADDGTAAGTLERGGRSHPVQCELE
jgi:hypothetical protein